MSDRILALAERSFKVERNLDSKHIRREKQALSKKELAQKRQARQLRRRLARGAPTSVKPPKETVRVTTRDRNRSRLAKHLASLDSMEHTPVVPYFDPLFDVYVFEEDDPSSDTVLGLFDSSSDEEIDDECGPMPIQVEGCCFACMHWH
jgi:hypothetical protein